jgi:hypothetical protein
MGQLFLSDIDHKPSSDIAVSKRSMPSRWVSRWLTVAIAGTVLALTLVVTLEQGPQVAGVTPAGYGRSIPVSLIGSGTFTLPDPTSKSVTYSTALVPVDAAILASLEPSGGGDRPQTVATLTVAGFATQPRLRRSRAHQAVRRYRGSRRAALPKSR